MTLLSWSRSASDDMVMIRLRSLAYELNPTMPSIESRGKASIAALVAFGKKNKKERQILGIKKRRGVLLTIGVRDQFCLGGLRSIARIFDPLLARKSSGFARILHDFFFARKWLVDNSREGGGGGASAPSSPPPPPRTHMLLTGWDHPVYKSSIQMFRWEPEGRYRCTKYKGTYLNCNNALMALNVQRSYL